MTFFDLVIFCIAVFGIFAVSSKIGFGSYSVVLQLVILCIIYYFRYNIKAVIHFFIS